MFYIVVMRQERTFQLLPLHVLCTNLLCRASVSHTVPLSHILLGLA